MSRRIPDSRFQDLVDAATRAFIAQGYRRTQMDDVAEALGVAKGTVYLYVESKEALFDLALRSADVPRPLARPARLPVPPPRAGGTLRWVKARLAERPASPTLAAALGRRGGGETRELARILDELYDAMERNRTAIKLVDRSAVEYPALAEVWFSRGRRGLLTGLTRYLERGMREGALRQVPDPVVAARLVLETVVFWAVHRHWDPSPQALDPRLARETVVQMLVGALQRRGGGLERLAGMVG